LIFTLLEIKQKDKRSLTV